MEKLGRFWGHKHWKVRHGLLQFVAEAVATSGETALVPPRDESAWVLHKAIALVGDPERCVIAWLHSLGAECSSSGGGGRSCPMHAREPQAQAGAPPHHPACARLTHARDRKSVV